MTAPRTLYACDVYTSLNSIRNVIIDFDVFNQVFIPSDFFRKELEASFTTEASLRRQLTVDLPRQTLHVEGVRIRNIDELEALNVNPAWYPCMTQTIMFFPMIVLHGRGDFILAECTDAQPLCIDLSDRVMIVRKTIRILPLDIKVHMHMHVHDKTGQDPVTISYIIESYFSSPTLDIESDGRMSSALT